jgi:hypothetical protein
MRGERFAKKPTVVATDGGKDIIPDAPYKIRRTLDVTEEEGHGAWGSGPPSMRPSSHAAERPSMRGPAVRRRAH